MSVVNNKIKSIQAWRHQSTFLSQQPELDCKVFHGPFRFPFLNLITFLLPYLLKTCINYICFAFQNVCCLFAICGPARPKQCLFETSLTPLVKRAPFPNSRLSSLFSVVCWWGWPNQIKSSQISDSSLFSLQSHSDILEYVFLYTLYHRSPHSYTQKHLL